MLCSFPSQLKDSHPFKRRQSRRTTAKRRRRKKCVGGEERKIRDLSSEKIQSGHRHSLDVLVFLSLLVTLSDRIICQKQLNFNRKQSNMSIFDPVKQLSLITIMSAKHVIISRQKQTVSYEDIR